MLCKGEDQTLQKRATIILTCAAVLGIAAAILGGIYYVSAHANAVAKQVTLATSRQPEPLTELYVAQPEQLPTSVPTASHVLAVSFVIHNMESQTTTYTYRISYIDASGTTSLPDTQLQLEDGQSQTITKALTLPAGQTRGQVSVQLIGKSQAVHFWLERK